MRNAVKIVLSSAIVLTALFGDLYSQGTTDTSASVKGKAVKWEALNGKDNEFIFFMPAGYITTSNSDYYKGGRKGVGAHIEKELKIARYINGVVLMVEYYEGEAKQVQSFMIRKSTADKSEEINGFDVQFFSENKDKKFHKTQYFQIKNRLYVAKTISFVGDSDIVKAFFESIRLFNNNVVEAPNVTKNTKTVVPADLVEQEAAKLTDSEAIDEKDADRRVIILKAQIPKFPVDMIRTLNSGRLKVRVLYSSSGKVTNVEVLESPSKQLEKAAIEAAKNAVFIPAEKDGKLISVYQMQEYTFGVTTEIRSY